MITDKDIEHYVNRILSGKLLFSYKNRLYTLLYPNITLRYKASLLYESIINDEKYNEWITVNNLEKYMEYLGVWNREMAEFMNHSPKQLESLKVSLYQNRLNSALTKKNRQQISYLRTKMNSVSQTKQYFYNQTVEGFAESIKHEFIIVNTLYYKKNKVFNKFKSNNNSSNDFNNLVTEINNYTLDTSIYRSIARSDFWRSFWNINKNNIIDKPICEWTDEQRTLASYTSMYDGVYEHHDKPNDSVIEDDDMLDGWLIHQRKEYEKSKQENSLLNNNNKLAKAQEVFIFTDTQEGIKEITEMNSQEALLDIAQRRHSIEKNGEINQSSLIDVQKQIRK
jgi:hypothetical protein